MRYSIIVLLFLLGPVARAQQDTLIIHFEVDRADIRPSDAASLDSIARNPIRIAGHTDNSGSDDHNTRLSLLRAQAVRSYLHTKGWPDSLFLNVNGLGSSRPLNDNSTAAQKFQNRRVELIFLHSIPSAAPTPADAPPPGTSPPDDDPNTTIYHRPPTLQEIFKDTASLVGKNIILRNVNFYGDRHVPLPGSDVIVLQLAAIMKEYPALHIEIQGYVCCMSDGYDGRDADTHAPDLSVQRAKFVYDFLVSQGIKKNRMSYKGFGASNKIYPEERDEQQRSANRRVEIKIITFNP